MGGLSNEAIFHMGLVAIICCVIAAAVVWEFFRLRIKRLNERFDGEYGEIDKKRR